jgi:surface polysaccharide O-acyltransferase-like enzyme
MEERKSNFEMPRIVSMALIVAFHYVYKAGFDFTGVSANKLLVDFFYHFGELGVNCFILISGYFYDSTHFKWKKIFFILFQVWFYLILCRGVLVITGNAEMTSWGMTSLLFPILRNYYWFITVYVYIYILIPYIQRLINALSKKELRNLILIQLLIWSMYPTIVLGVFGVNNTENMPYYSRYIWLIIMYLIGAYIKQYGIVFLGNLKKSIMFECAVTAAIMVFIVTTEYGRNPLSMNATYFWPPNSLLMVMFSVGLFMIFSQIQVGYHKCVNYVSSCTLGIYMLHDGELASFWWNTIFQNASHQNQSNLIFHILLAVVLVMLLGILCESFRKMIEIPIRRVLHKPKYENLFA